MTLAEKLLQAVENISDEKLGGSRGIKNLGLVESSLNSGIATFDGEDLYPSIEEKISMITYSFTFLYSQLNMVI